MAYRVFNGLFALLFLYSASLQFNDPDPLRWIVIYGAAAIPCLLAVWNKLNWRLPALIAAVALVWAATHVPHVAKFGQLGHMFDHWKMENEDVVYGRELFGLLIVAGWMLFLTFAERKRRSSFAS
ncbi:MAG TPA: transmembrane 220 family protein [Opitutaceae bacterium]|nr:transmembrane 220 family protein [Opitutaceae bacterium]